MAKVPILLSLIGDFHLVHADERAQERQLCRLFNDRQVLRCLRGDLPQAIACDESPAVFAFGEFLRDADHDASVEHHAKWGRRVRHNVALNLPERDDVELSTGIDGL